MKQPLYYALGLITVGCVSAIFCIQKARGINESDSYSEKSVGNHAFILKRAADTAKRTSELSEGGAQTYTYQLALAEASQLPSRLEKIVAESSLTLVGRSFERPWSITVTGNHLNVLRLLSKIEKEIPDLKFTSSKWTGQSDGGVTVQATYDLWSVPQPNSGKS